MIVFLHWGFDRVDICLGTSLRISVILEFPNRVRLAHLQTLDELGTTEQWLDGIPATKIAHFAGEARVG